jgi:hypothetical protein
MGIPGIEWNNGESLRQVLSILLDFIERDI